MSDLRKELAEIDALIAHNTAVIEAAQERNKTLIKQRASKYVEGMVPIHMMSEERQREIRKMPRWNFVCEYCEADEVRKGKILICIGCGHVQGGIPPKKLIE